MKHNNSAWRAAAGARRLKASEHMRLAALIVSIVVFMLVGCSGSESEGSMKYYDSHRYNRFIEKLEENRVNYRRGDGLEVYYPMSQSQLVGAIASEISAEYHPGCGGSFTTKEKQEAMEAELKKRGVSYSVVQLDQGPALTCMPEDREAFHEAFMYVLRKENDE